MSPKIPNLLTASVTLALPSWIDEVVDRKRAYLGDDDKVALAIELSRHNIELGDRKSVV